MYIKRNDNGCEAEVLAAKNGRVLLRARWPIGEHPRKQQNNTVNVSEDYFREKYGRDPEACLLL